MGLPTVLGPHCLRHSYATRLTEDGWDPLFVQRQLGHSWASTTAMYTGVSANYQNQMLRRYWIAGSLRRPGGAVMAMRRLGYRWKLREVMAARQLWHTTELRPLLVERGIDLSPAQVHRLVTQTPERLSLRTLMALCDALDCEVGDLLERVAEARRPGSAAPARRR